MTGTPASQRADQRRSATRAAIAEARAVLTAAVERHGHRCPSTDGDLRCMRVAGHHGPHEAHDTDHRIVTWEDTDGEDR